MFRCPQAKRATTVRVSFCTEQLMFKKTMLLVLPIIATCSQAQSAPKSDAPAAVQTIDVKKGDQWVYKVRDDITGTVKFTSTFAVTAVTDSEIDVRHQTKVGTNGQESSALEVYDRHWRMIEGPRGTYKSYSSNSGIAEELVVGKQWTYSYEHTPASGKTVWTWTGHAEVQAMETVTLPSGESFDAFRIEFVETTSKVSNPGILVIGGDNEPTKRTDFKTVEWYAPKVNREIKRTYETRQNGKLFDAGSSELISYSRAEAR
jgi:hypothetical protein